MALSLADLPMLRGVSPTRIRGLEDSARRRRYPSGQIVCSAGDPVDHLIVLLAGRIKSSLFTADGRELVLTTSIPPIAFDKTALLLGRSHRATLTALTPVEIAYIPRALVLDLIESEPAVSARLLRTLAESVCDLNERLVDVALLDVRGRVAKWLLRQSADGRVTLPAGQAGLAAELGATRVSVNRALKALERRGLIKLAPGGQVYVHDERGLRKFAAQ